MYYSLLNTIVISKPCPNLLVLPLSFFSLVSIMLSSSFLLIFSSSFEELTSELVSGHTISVSDSIVSWIGWLWDCKRNVTIKTMNLISAIQFWIFSSLLSHDDCLRSWVLIKSQAHNRVIKNYYNWQWVICSSLIQFNLFSILLRECPMSYCHCQLMWKLYPLNG